MPAAAEMLMSIVCCNVTASLTRLSFAERDFDNCSGEIPTVEEQVKGRDAFPLQIPFRKD